MVLAYDAVIRIEPSRLVREGAEGGKWYAPRLAAVEPIRVVIARNQFGYAEFYIDNQGVGVRFCDSREPDDPICFDTSDLMRLDPPFMIEELVKGAIRYIEAGGEPRLLRRFSTRARRRVLEILCRIGCEGGDHIDVSAAIRKISRGYRISRALREGRRRR